MAKTEIDRKKVERLLEAITVPLAQVNAIVEELRVVTSGGQTIGEQLNEYYAVWGEAHRAAGYQGAYQFNYKIDVPNIKRLLKRLGKDELFARIDRYHRDGDRELRRNKHPHGWFVTGINRYASTDASELTLEIAAVGCAHTPPCTSDQQHTMRKLSEQATR